MIPFFFGGLVLGCFFSFGFELDFTVPSSIDRFIAVKKYSDKYLKAIFEKSNDKITVITFTGRGDPDLWCKWNTIKKQMLCTLLRKTKYDISEELAENVVIDLDKKGLIIGIEVLRASKNLGNELVTKIINAEEIAATA
jgi:uncharacterized protein YuzE